MRGSMDANFVLAAQRGIMSGGGPRYDPRSPTDYSSAEMRFTRQADAVGSENIAPMFVLGMRSRFPLLDIQSQLTRDGRLTGPWIGTVPQGITRKPTQMTATLLAKVTS